MQKCQLIETEQNEKDPNAEFKNLMTSTKLRDALTDREISLEVRLAKCLLVGDAEVLRKRRWC